MRLPGPMLAALHHPPTSQEGVITPVLQKRKLGTEEPSLLCLNVRFRSWRRQQCVVVENAETLLPLAVSTLNASVFLSV